MSRHAYARRPALAALILFLLATAAVQAVPARPAPVRAPSAPSLAAAWHWLARLLPASLIAARGGEGAAEDPDGRPANAVPGYSVIKGEQGAAVDPDGHH